MTATLFAKGLTVEVFDKAGEPVAAPTIERFVAVPESITAGRSVILSWQTTNADSVEIGPDIGIELADGFIVVTPTANTTYELAATGPGGTTVATVSVFVSAPVDTGLGIITSKSVNTSKMLMMTGYMKSLPGYNPGRYNRQQYLCILNGDSATMFCQTNNLAAGGASVPFGRDATLTLLFNGEPVATQDVLATDVAVTFTIDLRDVAEDYYLTSVSGLDASWTVMDYWAYVLKGPMATMTPTRMPVITGSYTVEFGHMHHTAWVPAQCNPIVMPLVPRECPHFSELPQRANLIYTQIVHGRGGDIYRPNITKEGVICTAGKQPYEFSDFMQPKPILPLLDGVRGRGSVFCPTHLEISQASPTAEHGNAIGPTDHIFGTDPWRVFRVLETGRVETLAGWVHDDLPQHWQDPPIARLAGDWSRIPQERWGFHELWGIAWWVFPIDMNAAPIPDEANLKPHTFGVRQYVSDQRTVMPNGVGRLVQMEYSATSHATPPIVTELNGDGWNQCFDVASNGHWNAAGQPIGGDAVYLWASDRMAHRIRVVRASDGVIVDEWGNIPQPEGVFMHERADGLWLYYTTTVRSGGAERGAIINFGIHRRHIVTGEDVLIWDFTTHPEMSYYINGNTLLGKIAVSDGSFGPPGMIGLATWSNSYYGCPLLFDGETGAMINWRHVDQYGPPIKGMGDPGMTYTSAIAFGNGRMIWGTATEGIIMLSKALDTDTVWPASVAAGETEYKDRGRIQTHGHYGMGQYGLKLPWGESANQDAFLMAHGHKL